MRDPLDFRGGLQKVAIIPILLVVAQTLTPVRAQARTWREWNTNVHPRCQMVYDAARDRYVAYSAGNTLEWDGAQWVVRKTARSPGSRYGARMVYDLSRARTVLFGGTLMSNPRFSVVPDDVWEYDGRDWAPMATGAVRPPGRYDHAMVYDWLRQRTIVWGGQQLAGSLGDTWEWDGRQWTAGPVGPVPSAGAAMGFHAPSGRVVLFGSEVGTTWSPVTWTYDGTAWRRERPMTMPQVRLGQALFPNFSTGQLYMYGGRDPQLWEWTGTNWTAPAFQAPPARRGFGVAADLTGRALLLGGVLSDPSPQPTTFEMPTGATLEFVGTTWRTLDAGGPVPAIAPRVDYDRSRNRLVMVDGDTGGHRAWEWDGTQWFPQTTAFAPPPSTFSKFAIDQSRGVGVLFGGLVTSPAPGLTNTTHEWDGLNWTLAQPANSPPPSYLGSMTSNPGGGVLLVASGQTWIYSGGQWQNVAVGQGPPTRGRFAMATDTTRGVVVLFGGVALTSTQLFIDTWEWDGVRWRQLPTVAAPPGRVFPAMEYDAVRRRTVLIGGFDLGSVVFTDEWEWDGQSWTQVGNNAPAALDVAAGLTFDSVRGALVLAQPRADGNHTHSHDLWIGATTNLANTSEGGVGCGAGPAGGPNATIHGRGAPALGAGSFAVDLVGGPVNALMFLGVASTRGANPLGNGCTLYLQGSLGSVTATTNRFGFASFALPIPADPALLGFTATAQGAGLTANRALALSSYLDLTLGY